MGAGHQPIDKTKNKKAKKNNWQEKNERPAPHSSRKKESFFLSRLGLVCSFGKKDEILSCRRAAKPLITSPTSIED